MREIPKSIRLCSVFYLVSKPQSHKCFGRCGYDLRIFGAREERKKKREKTRTRIVVD